MEEENTIYDPAQMCEHMIYCFRERAKGLHNKKLKFQLHNVTGRMALNRGQWRKKKKNRKKTKKTSTTKKRLLLNRGRFVVDSTRLQQIPKRSGARCRPQTALLQDESKITKTAKREKSKTLELHSFHSCQEIRRTKES